MGERARQSNFRAFQKAKKPLNCRANKGAGAAGKEAEVLFTSPMTQFSPTEAPS
jgi:hypothetical protein